MVGRIYHVGLTVSDLDKSIAFYRDILGLKYQGEIMMVGEETDKMFQKKNCYNLRSSPRNREAASQLKSFDFPA